MSPAEKISSSDNRYKRTGDPMRDPASAIRGLASFTRMRYLRNAICAGSLFSRCVDPHRYNTLQRTPTRDRTILKCGIARVPPTRRRRRRLAITLHRCQRARVKMKFDKLKKVKIFHQIVRKYIGAIFNFIIIIYTIHTYYMYI